MGPARPYIAGPMAARLLFDLSHTSHTRARTGIQRVARALHAALGEQALGITHDPHRDAWRPLESWEYATLGSQSPAAKRGAQWPLGAKLRGRARRWLSGTPPALPANSGLLVPELFSPAVARGLPALFAATPGPRVAIFHDAIALKHPELTPPKTVARFPGYLVELLAFDGIAAISEDSRASLLDYWRWLGARQTPPVIALPLGLEPLPAAAARSAPPADAPVVLSVGSIEGRKNHLALLEACESLWACGVRFTLHLIGLAQPQTARLALDRLRELQQAGRPLRYDGPVDDAGLAAAYAACAFTVYPSLMEGFGLPVLESLAHGKPCICSARGALGESSREGGCVTLDSVAAPELARAIQRLLDAPAERSALAAAAQSRPIKTWPHYATELTGWLRTLPRRG